MSKESRTRSLKLNLVQGRVSVLMVLDGVDVMREPLSRRRELLEQKTLPS